MNRIFLPAFIIASLFVGCVQKEEHPPFGSLGRTSTGIVVSSVSVMNNQLIVHGSGFSKITNVAIQNNSLSFNEAFAIESKSDSQIVANGLKNLSLVSNAFFDLILSSAEASSTYAITFTVSNGSITSAMLSSMGATKGQVMKFNGSSWVPSSITNAQTYLGTWNATANSPDLTLPSSNPGDYYIVSVGGTFSSVSYAVGDWIISDGYNWQKVANSSVVVSTFNGRRGIVTLQSSDYVSLKDSVTHKITGSSLNDLGDLDLTTVLPINGSVLKYNGTKWVAGVDSIGTSPVTSVNTLTGDVVLTTTNIAEGTNQYFTVARASGTTLTGDIGGTIGANTIGTGKVTLAHLSATGIKDATTYLAGDNVWKNFNSAVIAAPLIGLSSTGITKANGTLAATDSITTAFNKLLFTQGDYVSKTVDQTINGTLAINALTGFITVPTPVNPNDAANKGYVDSYGQWTKGTGANAADIYRSTGYVGIGVVAPTKLLEVNGDALISGMTVGKGGASVSSNTAIGTSALSTNTGGTNNTALGYFALLNNTSGLSNSATGSLTLYSNTTGNYNTANGASALYSNTSGINNTANGALSLNNNTTGYSNTANGYYALLHNTTGTENDASGMQSLLSNTIGSRNTTDGVSALYSNVAKNESTAIGYNSMYYADSTATSATSYSTAIGAFSLQGSSPASGNTGIKNTALGHSSLKGISSGSGNIGVGFNSGSMITSGNNNVIIGSNNGSTISTSSGVILIADGAGNERMRVDSFGNVGIGTQTPGFTLDVNGSIAAVGALQAHSDKRLKKNIVKVDNPMEKLLALSGVYFDWRKDEFPEIHFEGGRQMGVIAQDVEKVFPEAVSKNKNGIRSVAYTMLIAPMIEAFKEVDKRITDLFSTSKAHSRKIASINERVNKLEDENAMLVEENKMLKNYLCEKDPKARFCTR